MTSTYIEILREDYVYRGRRVSLKKLQLKIDSDIVFREVVEFGEAVAALPIKDNNRIVLIKQFRPAINRWIIEIPAGKLEPNETPEECIKRELVEEIGYRPKTLIKLCSLYLTPGYSNEVLHLYIAKDLEYIGRKPERYELIEVMELNIDDALKLLESQDVIDAKTYLAITLYIVKHRGI